MANRFQHLIPAAQEAPTGGLASGNRFAHLIPKKATPAPVSGEGKGNRERSWGETVDDTVRSGVAGLARGAIGLAGLPGDIASLTQRGVEYVGGEGAGKTFAKINPTSYLPTSEQIQGRVEGATGKFHEPQTTAGEYGRTIGEFAPAAAAGPGGLIRKTAMAVIPGVASQAAGDIPGIKGTDYEPIARATAAIAGGGLASGVHGGTNAVKSIAKDAPTHKAVGEATDALYTQLRGAGIKYDSNAFDMMANNLADKLRSQGFRKAQAPLSADALEAIGENAGKAIDFNEFESLRRTASKIMGEASATSTDKAAAGLIVDALDEFSKKAAYIHNGTAPNAPELMNQARELGRRNIIARHIDEMLQKAETYQSGIESGVKNQFSNYLRSNKGKGLTPAERLAFMQVAKGGFTRNALTTLGRFGLDLSKLGHIATLVPTLGAGVATYQQRPDVAAALLVAGTGAKYGARKMAVNAADRAKSVVTAGRPAQKEAMKLTRKNIVQNKIRRLLNAEAAIQSGRNTDR